MGELISSSLLKDDLLITKEEILSDYRMACESREVSLLGRKDVFMGRAKFGIFGDGKELPQIALSKFFRKGDFRSGYYRDQTIIAATGVLTWQQLFAQLYAHQNIEHDVFSAGRSMNAHYGNPWIDKNGQWLKQTESFNHVMDVSSTAGQIPRSMGLAYASKLYRENPHLAHLENFSNNGNEICFTTIGDASTSQGMFFEAINAAGVLQIPVIFSVWDDGYGISVPSKYQTTKQSISAVLAGFQSESELKGLEIFKVEGWDYLKLINTYKKAARLARDEHKPCLVHVVELTQPQGHSSSGSHERYKSDNRLEWEREFDCNQQFKKWILAESIASEDELLSIENDAKEIAKTARQNAWNAFRNEIETANKPLVDLLKIAVDTHPKNQYLIKLKKEYTAKQHPLRKDILSILKKATRQLKNDTVLKQKFAETINEFEQSIGLSYGSHLYSEFATSPLLVKEQKPKYSTSSKLVDGREIMNLFFDGLFQRNPAVFALGEDIGKIGDVNQGFAGLQEKYGEIRITDTGIREATIIGQGIGAAMRGLRPIVEVQYLDYIYYCLPLLTDDLACLRYRTFGRQAAPMILRTRGHRLEGIWHSGSPMAVLVNALRGIHICVPRNFVQAAGLYNTLLAGDDPGLMIEPLNAYRLKEKLPENLAEIKVKLGKCEILKEGSDITIVTYGSMCKIVMAAAQSLAEVGISAEIIDAQTLLPFDIDRDILQSIKKTARIIFADEDMPGGTTAYMMQEVLDKQGGYFYLDAKPVCISAKEHRPPYGSEGDYFTKPNEDLIFDVAYKVMHEAKPAEYPLLY